ncbi:RNA-binding protein with serine-rich domain 1-A, partial [Bulinus truncatus]
MWSFNIANKQAHYKENQYEHQARSQVKKHLTKSSLKMVRSDSKSRDDKDKSDKKKEIKDSKERGRDRKRRGGSSSSDSRSSSSSSRSRSGSRSSSSGSSSSGSSSSGSSSRSGSSSSNRSSSSDSSRSRGRDRKQRTETPKRKKRSPTPKPTKVHVGHLTRNVTKDHIQEIFSLYGTIKNIDMLMDRIHAHFNRGTVYIEYETAEEAAKAIKFMDGGQIDGQEVTAAAVHVQRNPTRPPARRSPPRRGGPPPRWRASPPRFNRDRR